MKQLIIMTATDEELKELKEHLSNNGYRSEWTSNSIILVDDDETSELYEILTIIDDREIKYFTSPVELDDILNDIKEQFENERDYTGYGEPRAWVYLPNGRTIEVTHEEEGLDTKDQYFSVRLHCTDKEFDNMSFDTYVGVIESCCTPNTPNVMNVEYITSALSHILCVNDNTPLEE